MSTTIITALFDINRQRLGDGRTMDDYKTWFQQTLGLNCPMVVFTEEQFVDFVKLHRGSKPTQIVVRTLDTLPYSIYEPEMSRILKLDSYQQTIQDSSRIECRLSWYNIIQYSKFEWLRETIENQYFTTDYYVWMDAGCSRFFGGLDCDWPKNDLFLPDALTIQGNKNTQWYDDHWPGDDVYALDNNCIVVGTLFGGPPRACIAVADKIHHVFKEYLAQNIVNNEQILLGILRHREPTLFNVYTNLNGHHLPLFEALR